jgi:hypothetical protein
MRNVHAQGFSLITRLIMHLEKHSRAHCKAYEIVFLNTDNILHSLYNFTVIMFISLILLLMNLDL